MISLVLPSPAKSWFSIIVALILINLAPGSVFGNDYSSCTKSFSCGSFENIGYPFWGSDRPESCGYPGFGLTCRGDDVPEMTIGEVTYQVLEINNNTRNLRLARSDYWENICPQYLRNTTLISGLTYSSDTQNITLYYHCLPSSATRNSLSGDFSCSINGTDNIIGYIMTSLTDSEFNRSPINYTSLETCNSSVTVPVLKSQVPTVEANPNSGNLTQALRAGFDLQWSTADDSTCESCLNTGGQCGQDISSAQFRCYCTNGTFPNNCNGTPLSPAPGSAGLQRRHLTETVIIGFVVAGTAIIVLIFFIILWKKTGSLSPRKLIVLLRKQKMDDNASNNIEALITKYGSLAPKRCSYADIKKMTNKFKEKLGQGGFGSVYKGKLPDGRLVAVKVLSESKGNGEEFINEVASISRTSHVNIVALLGFCYERSKRALVYEFMANGSLDKFIYNQTRQLGWKTLYDIALGIARGLEYLHKGCNARILHFDIKPHNILLDENFCSKISDFGLSRLCERKEQSIISITGARGTIGYIAPEVFCRNFGGVSHKSDVYSYGMMVLEMVGGRKNVDVQVSKTSEIYFPSWIYKNLDQTVNLSLHGIIMAEEEEEITRKLIVVSLWCIQSDPSDRPSITKVIEMLQGSLQSLPIPPKPFASSPVRSPSRTSSST